MMIRQQRYWAGLAVSLAFSATTTMAATYLWSGSGTTNNWSDGANWTGNNVPVNDGTSQISLFSQTRPNMVIDTPYTVTGLMVDGAASYVLDSASSMLTLSKGGTGIPEHWVMGINNRNGELTVNNRLKITGSTGGTISVGSGKRLTLNNELIIDGVPARLSSYNVTTPLVINGPITGSSPLLAYNHNGISQVNGRNTYTGATYVWNHTVLVGLSDNPGVDGAFGASTNRVFLGAGGQAYNANVLTNGAYTITRDFQVNSYGTQTAAKAVLGGATADESEYKGSVWLGNYNNDSAGITLTAANGGTVKFSGNFILEALAKKTEQATLTKTGLGKVILTGTNNYYTGLTTVTQGTLQVNGKITGTGAGVSVNTGATLSGNGSINRQVDVSGVLAPGASIGMLTTGHVTFASGSQLAIELGHAVSDKLVVNGDLNLTNASLVLSGVPSGTNSFVIATYSGTLTGMFASVTGLSGFSLDYGTGTNSQITLLIPEPATISLLGLGGLMMVRGRKMAE